MITTDSRFIIRIEYWNKDYTAKAYRTLKAAKSAFTQLSKDKGKFINKISLTIDNDNSK